MTQWISQILWSVREQTLNAIVIKWNVFLGASFKKNSHDSSGVILINIRVGLHAEFMIITEIRLIPDFSTFNALEKTQIWNYSWRDNVE